jgi:hypothetical protein
MSYYKAAYLQSLQKFSNRKSPMVLLCLTLIIYHFLYDTAGVSIDEHLEASRILKKEWNLFEKKIG